MTTSTRRAAMVVLMALLVVMNRGVAMAKAMRIDLPTKIVSSELVARVKVSSTKIYATKTDAGLRRVAQCRVQESVKGLKKGVQFELEFDNGFACPNVLYKAGDDCIIFARLLANGRYSTCNTYFGKFTVQDGVVLGWRRHSKKVTNPNLDTVLAEIRGLTEMPEDWSEPVDGLSILLRPERSKYIAGEDIDLFFIIRNTSQKPIIIPYRDYPFETQTYWALDVRRSGNQAVGPTPHPHLTKDSIKDYFSKHGREYNMEINPGAIRSHYLPRINTAQKGWGYKEELRFAYYIMDKPGTYTVSAELHNAFPGRILKTKPIEIRIYEKDGQ
jgi:hypothetical protein